MMTDNIETSRCEMADGIVSYMYREMSPAERLEFEEHLLSCPACVDQFAEVADSRYSVYEWRKVEFDALPTPQILIPFNAPAQGSWFAKLREAFSFAPAWPTVGISSAAAAVLLAIGLAGYQSQSSGDVVANLGNPDAVESPVVVRAVVSEKPIEIEPTGILKTTETQEPATAPAPAISRQRPVRAERPQPVKSNRTADPKQQQTPPKQAVGPSTQQVPLPTFTEYAEQEDETLRLAELFDDIETRD